MSHQHIEEAILAGVCGIGDRDPTDDDLGGVLALLASTRVPVLGVDLEDHLDPELRRVEACAKLHEGLDRYGEERDGGLPEEG